MKPGNLLTVHVWAALFCLQACAPAWSMDLLQSYEAAVAQDATLQASRAGTDARRERLPQTDAQMLPNLSLGVSRTHNELESTVPNFLGKPVTSNTEYYSSNQTLTLRQTLFNRYRVADQQQAKAQVEDAEAMYERDLQNLAVRVSGAYFEALMADDQMSLVLAQKAAVTVQLDAARKRFATGAGTRTDIDEAQAALDLNAAQELEAHQNMSFTRRQLQALVDQPLGELSRLDAKRMKLLSLSLDGMPEWTERAERNSPEMRSLKAQIEAARQEVEKAKAGHYPTLEAIAQLSRSESDSVTNINSRYNNSSVGLQLSVPIYAGGYVNSTVRQALAEQTRAEFALEALRRDLGVRVHREFRGVTEGVLKVRALEQAVRSSEQLALSNRRSFEAGSRTLNDTLNAEQQRVSALRDLALARYTHLLSRVRLQALAGGTTVNVMEEINGWLVPRAMSNLGEPGKGLPVVAKSQWAAATNYGVHMSASTAPKSGAIPGD